MGVGVAGAPRREEDEVMSSVRVLSIAGAALWLALPAAQAADLPLSPPPVVYQPVEDFGGWYLRGDIGMSNQSVDHLDNVLYSTAVGLQQVSRGFEGAPFFVLGFGYRFNSWLRADVTGEYRSGSTFHGLDIYGTPPSGTDEYTWIKTEWVALANVYADLGTWWRVTPFVGVSAGFSYNKISNFLDVNTPNLGVAYAPDAWKFNFAWGATAGLAYNVNRNVTIEFAYRYLNLGDAQSGDIIAYTGANTVNNPMLLKGISSQDLKLGVRFSLEPEPVAPPPPLMRKG
jgi:opacity protein-like surface antigen